MYFKLHQPISPREIWLNLIPFILKSAMKSLFIHVMLKFMKKNSNKQCIILKLYFYLGIRQIFRDWSLEIISNVIYWVEKQVSYNLTFLNTQNNTIYANGCIYVQWKYKKNLKEGFTPTRMVVDGWIKGWEEVKLWSHLQCFIS